MLLTLITLTQNTQGAEAGGGLYDDELNLISVKSFDDAQSKIKQARQALNHLRHYLMREQSRHQQQTKELIDTYILDLVTTERSTLQYLLKKVKGSLAKHRIMIQQFFHELQKQEKIIAVLN